MVVQHTYAFQSHPSMYFVDLHSELILDTLNLTKQPQVMPNTERWAKSCHLASLQERPRTHGQVLSQALELTTYPVVRNFFSPFPFQFGQSLLKNRIRSYLLRFRILESNSD